MKTKSSALFTFLFIPVILMTASGKRQEKEWAGTIEKVEDSIVVENPLEPMSEASQKEIEENLVLEADLSLGVADGIRRTISRDLFRRQTLSLPNLVRPHLQSVGLACYN